MHKRRSDLRGARMHAICEGLTKYGTIIEAQTGRTASTFRICDGENYMATSERKKWVTGLS